MSQRHSHRRSPLIACTVLFLSVLAAALLSGCGEVSKVGTGIAQGAGLITAEQGKAITTSAVALDKSFQDITPEQEYYIGRAVVAQVLQSYPPLDQSEANTYVNLLGQSLAVFSKRPETFGGYHLLLLNSNEINAFAAPGGLILVTRGMLRCCTTEDELAAVLAHEICHVEKKHGLAAIKGARLTEAFVIMASESAKQLAGENLAKLTSQFEGSVNDVVKTLTTSGYSQAQEFDADNAAADLLNRAGYPKAAMITMLERMQKLTSTGGPGFAKTHPSAKSRIGALRVKTKRQDVPVDAARQQRFAAAMEPIVTVQ
jgi:predicted Zn-dependent protease